MQLHRTRNEAPAGARGERREFALGLLFLLTLLPALVVLPYYFPVNSDVASASMATGYNNRVAYSAAVAVALACAAAFAWVGRRGWIQITIPVPVAVRPSKLPSTGRCVLEIALVFAAFLALYFPLALARYGPYIEDSYALTAFYRMFTNQRPYLDFDFPYGPAMFYAGYGWLKAFGYSMRSYYTLIALAEAIQFGALVYVLQRLYPRFRDRLWVFTILAALLCNTLLSLNYNGMRKLFPVVIICMLAARPHSRRMVLAAGAVLGFLLAYSHEFAAATIVASATMYGLLFWQDRRGVNVAHLAVLWATAGAIWFVLAIALLRDAFPAYLRATVEEISRYNAGEMAFAFYWTVNSVAVFALLLLACAVAGKGIARGIAGAPLPGDLLLAGGIAYALVALRSGLQRADMWHLDPPLIVLIIAFMMPWPRRLFPSSLAAGRLAVILIAVIAATYLLALMPTASFVFRGTAMGMRDLLSGVSDHRRAPWPTRLISTDFERTEPDPDAVAAGSYLAAPERRQLPVFYYGRAWSHDKRIGAPKLTYATDDFFLQEKWGDRYRQEIERTSGALIVMETREYERLYGLVDLTGEIGAPDYYRPTFMKRLAGWLSTTHYKNTPIELQVKEDRWRKSIGYYVREEFVPAAHFGFFTVLERRSAFRRT
jgi:hypothetical protein